MTRKTPRRKDEVIREALKDTRLPHAPRVLDSLGHSITRYNQRWIPSASRLMAQGHLLRMIEAATFVEFDDQHEIWAARCPSGAADPVLLVVDDHVVMTVLEPGATKPYRRPGK